MMNENTAMGPADAAPGAAPTRELGLLAEAFRTAADLYALAFYPVTKDATEKMICCKHASEEMNHHLSLAEHLRGQGVEVPDSPRTPLAERRTYGVQLGPLLKTWADRAVYSSLVEAAIVRRLALVVENPHRASADVASRMIDIEEDHVAEGARILRTVCGTREGATAARAAVERLWPVVLSVLDVPVPAGLDAHGSWGLTKAQFVRDQLDDLGRLGIAPASATRSVQAAAV